VALVIWATVFGCIFIRGDDFISRLLSVVRWILLYPWLQRVGRMSYTVYLIHWPLILVLLSLSLHWRPALSSHSMALLLFLIGLPVILCVSAILHKYIELPGMALGKRLSYPRKAFAEPAPIVPTPAEN
jgi:peptidoglycan/LPS O-acetylase OafA/YrhL